MTATAAPPFRTFVYKSVGGVDYKLDCYPPTREHLERSSYARAPILLYAHGGALCAGTREWDGLVPDWLLRPALQAGFAVVSYDYTLLGPHSAHFIVEDIKDLYGFLRDRLNAVLPAHEIPVDPERMALCGSSAGGYVSFAAAALLPEALKAVISLYGAGGDLLTDWYLTEKKGPLLPDVPDVPILTDPAPFRAILDRPIETTPPTVYFPTTDPLEPRNLLLLYLLQTGTLLDALSGQQGVSAALRLFPHEEREALVRQHSPSLAALLPQLWTTERFPPTMILHGTADGIVKAHESRAMARKLAAVGVDVTLQEIEGADHGFDAEGAWERQPGGLDPELTRRKDAALASVLPWLLERI